MLDTAPFKRSDKRILVVAAGFGRLMNPTQGGAEFWGMRVEEVGCLMLFELEERG